MRAHDTKRASRSKQPHDPRERGKADKQERFSHDCKEKGFNEPTDSVVWKACLDAGLSADEFILWNIYPFHPHKKDDLLSNRTPTDDELAIGLSYTKELLSLTGSLPLLAIGKKSENTLLDAGFSVKGLRHPANGGANIFRNQLADFFRK